jgi:hypothetical protein
MPFAHDPASKRHAPLEFGIIADDPVAFGRTRNEQFVAVDDIQFIEHVTRQDNAERITDPHHLECGVVLLAGIDARAQDRLLLLRE